MTGNQDYLTPGTMVTHPTHAEWGKGQVQSRIGDKITVMFEHAGKVVLDGKQIVLLPWFDGDE